MKTKLSTTLAILVLSAVLGLAPAFSPAPAHAVDNMSSTDAPDLTSVRVKIKAKEYVAALAELRKLAEDVQYADVYNLLGFTLRKTGDFKTSKFKDCDTAWDTARACLYIIRQYEKAITATMYAQLQLMALDKKLADYGLSKGVGTLIKADLQTPARPPHMRQDAQGAHWAFTLGNDPKEDAAVKLGTRT